MIWATASTHRRTIKSVVKTKTQNMVHTAFGPIIPISLEVSPLSFLPEVLDVLDSKWLPLPGRLMA